MAIVGRAKYTHARAKFRETRRKGRAPLVSRVLEISRAPQWPSLAIAKISDYSQSAYPGNADVLPAVVSAERNDNQKYVCVRRLQSTKQQEPQKLSPLQRFNGVFSYRETLLKKRVQAYDGSFGLRACTHFAQHHPTSAEERAPERSRHLCYLIHQRLKIAKGSPT